jgi:hypothetical protein
MVSLVNTFPQAFLEVLHHSCSMEGEIPATSSLMFCFKSTVVLGFFSYTLVLRYPYRKKSQALRPGDLAGHSVVPLREITRAQNNLQRTRSVSRCPVLLKPDSLGFNTKSLQCQFQKCAKHLTVAG